MTRSKMPVAAAGLLLGCLATSLALAQPTHTPADAPAAVAPAAASARTAQVLEAWVKRLGFQGSVLIARHDQPLLEASPGTAGQASTVGNTPGRGPRYLLASVSKQFTAAAVLRLADQGRLGLDDPVRQHLPELPRAWQAVTVRQLLAHTSGIPNHTEGERFEQTKHRAWTPRELLASFADRPLEFEPGRRFRYSNSGYIVAGVLIEQLSGQRLDRFLQDQFFTPLGMADTGLATGEQTVARLTPGYRRRPGQAGTASTAPDAKALQSPAALHLSVPYAAGALYGTPRDLLTWQRALYGGQVLSPDGLRAMTTVQRDGYALGLAVAEARPAQPRRLMHSGGIDGFSSYLLYEPDTGITVALLANLEGLRLDRMAHQLADTASRRPVVLPEERRTITLPAAALALLPGAYERPDEPGSTFWVALSDGRLWARAGTEPWRALQAQDVDDRQLLFYAPVIDAELRFHRSADGRVRAVEPVSDNGVATPLWQRVDKPLPTIAGQTLYLRGSTNQWGTTDRLQHDGAGRYRLTLPWPAGEHTFKLASADWSAVDLGAGDDQPPLDTARAPSGTLPLAAVGGNLVLRLTRSATCRFELDVRDPVQPVLQWACSESETAAPPR